MAKFTDQFDRYPPNHSLPSIAIPTWPTLVRNEALVLLSGFDDEMLVDIGSVLEDMIASAAQPFNFPVAKDAFIWTRIEPHWVSPTFTPKSSNEVRNTFGELNIFLCQCGPPNEQELEYKLAFGPKVERWHLLAVLALWKLVDCSDVMLGRAAHNIDGMIPRNKDLRFQNAAGIAMEAQAAISDAKQFKARAQHVEEMRLAVLAQEQQKRSGRASVAGDTRAQIYSAIGDEAFKIANNFTKRYVNNTGLSEAIYAQLSPKYDTPFKPSSVRHWLTERGWKRKK